MALKLGNANYQIQKLGKEIKFDERRDIRMEGRLNVLDKQLKNVKKEEEITAVQNKHAEEHFKDINKRSNNNEKRTHDIEKDYK